MKRLAALIFALALAKTALAADVVPRGAGPSGPGAGNPGRGLKANPVTAMPPLPPALAPVPPIGSKEAAAAQGSRPGPQARNLEAIGEETTALIPAPVPQIAPREGDIYLAPHTWAVKSGIEELIKLALHDRYRPDLYRTVEGEEKVNQRTLFLLLVKHQPPKPEEIEDYIRDQEQRLEGRTPSIKSIRAMQIDAYYSEFPWVDPDIPKVRQLVAELRSFRKASQVITQSFYRLSPSGKPEINLQTLLTKLHEFRAESAEATASLPPPDRYRKVEIPLGGKSRLGKKTPALSLERPITIQAGGLVFRLAFETAGSDGPGLYFTREGGQPRHIEPGRAFLIGRSGKLNDYAKEDAKRLSAKHLSIAFDGNAIVIEDLHSTNGTKVSYEVPVPR